MYNTIQSTTTTTTTTTTTNDKNDRVFTCILAGELGSADGGGGGGGPQGGAILLGQVWAGAHALPPALVLEQTLVQDLDDGILLQDLDVQSPDPNQQRNTVKRLDRYRLPPRVMNLGDWVIHDLEFRCALSPGSDHDWY